ncbi:hypothetical protein JXJ21_04540 [candidate division KSB1 bacterium]|nr:hypothetical protein [candidate division KSB1 bacterium]
MKKMCVLVCAILLVFSCAKEQPDDVPKTLLFSGITPEHLQATAAEWRANGFDGFLLAQIMNNWSDDIWARDGDSTTRGEDDSTFLRVKTCNDVCRKHGITENFVKVAFYDYVPLWTDDAAWAKFNQNFNEAARFAKMTGCRGVALDIEYISEQYELDWEQYDYQGYTQADLRTAALRRGRELVQTMLQSFPEMVFLNLPEGIYYYGPLAKDIFIGMITGMAEANAPGGFHLLTEKTYSMTSTIGILHYARKIEADILNELDPATAEYWKTKCSVAFGGWPLGYYRKILDENGNFLGYSGRQEKYGDKIVGSYADKSQRFTPEEFRNQYAGLLLGCRKYCWIYGHGYAWWHLSEEEMVRYREPEKALGEVDDQIDAFRAVVREKWRGSAWMQSLSEKANDINSDEFLKSLHFVTNFKIIGPFGCKDCDGFNEIYPPEKEINFDAEYVANAGTVKWQTSTADKQSGYLDFVKYLKPSDWVCAYAWCKVKSPEARSAQLRLGTNDTGTLWLNGEKILSKNIERSAAPDTDILPVELKAGENTVLIKVCNTEFNWGLYLRFTDSEGNALTSLEYQL